jgi:BirA family biotin operon repressor/biotin-[acetyl-CoA-carboxylase] ligase
MLSKERIEKELKKLGIEPPKIVFYEEIDSTNTRAKEYAKASEQKETVIFIANAQMGGRGRRGRSFVSRSGCGIYMSLLTYPEKGGFDATRATAEAAVSLARAIDSLCGCKTRIKWVNDIFLGGKKLAGILTEGEMDSDGKIAYQVVGMGINVYKNAISEEILDIATSLEDQISAIPDRSCLVASIIKEIMRPDGDFYTEYKRRNLVIGKNITVLKLTEQYDARVIDIESDYSLLIDRDGVRERLVTGEISIKI